MRSLFFIPFLALIASPAFAQDSTTTHQEIVYGHKLGMGLTTIMVKPKKTNGKAIIYIISGNWISNYNSYSRSVDAVKPFSDAGYTTFITMHSSAPRFDISEAISDIKRAIQFLRFNAATYGIDPNNIGITGHSSGGHLALLAGTSDDISNAGSRDPVERVSSRVQAVAVFYPPTDFLNWSQKGFSPVTQKALLQQYGVLGAFEFKQFDSTKFMYTPIEDPEKIVAIAKSLSPAQLVTADDAPVYIVHGDKDRVVPLQQSQLLQEKYLAAKLPFELKIRPDADHGWPNQAEDRKEFVKWFDKYLKVK